MISNVCLHILQLTNQIYYTHQNLYHLINFNYSVTKEINSKCEIHACKVNLNNTNEQELVYNYKCC